jgi:hypothetical protein
MMNMENFSSDCHYFTISYTQNQEQLIQDN